MKKLLILLMLGTAYNQCNESTEEKIIDALYSSVEDVVKETIVSKL
tara:strand:- start:362 stop:499 length:138 start_codon:yes stop_codon:yes gene_type:complete